VVKISADLGALCISALKSPAAALPENMISTHARIQTEAAAGDCSPCHTFFAQFLASFGPVGAVALKKAKKTPLAR
jgi:hypothetical protein